MKVWAIRCENEYTGDGHSLVAIFDNKTAADQVCAALNKLAARKNSLQEWFYGSHAVVEMDVGSQPSDFAQLHEVAERSDLCEQTPPEMRKILINLGYLKDPDPA